METNSVGKSANPLYDCLIIGAGPAGMTAGIYAVRKGLKTLVIGKEVGGQVEKSGEIENYLGFGSSNGAEVTQKFHQHIDEFENLEHKEGVLVTSLKKNNGNFLVRTEQGDFTSKSVIIASGRNPRKLGVPGEEQFKNKGVTYCEVCDAPLFRDKVTAVIGGGNSGLEAAVSLALLSPKIYILNIDQELKGDEILTKKIESLKNVEVINNAQTLKIEGDKFVKSLTYRDRVSGQERKIDVEGVFIEIGYVPSNEFDKITKKDQWDQIEIDVDCRTSVLGVFAAGDVTNISFDQIIIAAGEGAKAALSAYQYLTRKE